MNLAWACAFLRRTSKPDSAWILPGLQSGDAMASIEFLTLPNNHPNETAHYSANRS
jgi:hypothetical protein